MATIVDELIYKVGFDVDKDGLNKIGDGFAKVTKVATMLGTAAAAAGTAVFALTNKIATQLDDMDEFAKSIGISTQELQKLQFVGERLGVGVDGTNTALKFMVKNLADAANETGPAVEALAALGLSAEQLQGLEPDQQLRLIADGMAGVSDEGQRVAIAMDIFGRSGAAMVTMLKDGAPAIDAIAGRMTNLVPQKTIDDASKFKDSMQELWDVLGSMGTMLAAEVMPIITDLVARFREFFIQNREIIQSGIRAFLFSIYIVLRSLFAILSAGVRIVQWVVDAFGGLMPIFRLLQGGAVILAVMGLWRALTFVLATLRAITFMGIVGFIFRIVDGLKMLILWLRATSISLRGILIATGIGLVLLALQDLFSWVNGEPSLMGLLFGSFETAFAKLKAGFEQVKVWISQLWNSPEMRAIMGGVAGGMVGGPVGAVLGSIAGYTSAAVKQSNNTTNNAVNTTNNVQVHGVTDPNAAASMVGNHLNQQASLALATSNRGRR